MDKHTIYLKKDDKVKVIAGKDDTCIDPRQPEHRQLKGFAVVLTA